MDSIFPCEHVLFSCLFLSTLSSSYTTSRCFYPSSKSVFLSLVVNLSVFLAGMASDWMVMALIDDPSVMK